MKMYLILSTFVMSWLGSALYIRRPSSLFSLRRWKSYGGDAAFLWECCFYNSIDWFDFISPRDCFMKMSYHFILGLISYRREIDLWRCISIWIFFSRHSLFHGLVRLTTIHRPSSLFSLRRWKSYGGRGAAFLWECRFYNSIDWFDFISPRDCFIDIVSLIGLVWFHHLREIGLWSCISIWILISRHSLFHGLVRLTTIRRPSSLFSLRR